MSSLPLHHPSPRPVNLRVRTAPLSTRRQHRDRRAVLDASLLTPSPTPFPILNVLNVSCSPISSPLPDFPLIISHLDACSGLDIPQFSNAGPHAGAGPAARGSRAELCKSVSPLGLTPPGAGRMVGLSSSNAAPVILRCSCWPRKHFWSPSQLPLGTREGSKCECDPHHVPGQDSRSPPPRHV